MLSLGQVSEIRKSNFHHRVKEEAWSSDGCHGTGNTVPGAVGNPRRRKKKEKTSHEVSVPGSNLKSIKNVLIEFFMLFCLPVISLSNFFSLIIFLLS